MIGVLLLCGFSGAEDPSLAYRISVSRGGTGESDSVLVIASATNTGTSPIRTWGMLDFSGQYRLSAEGERRRRALADSIAALERRETIYRCREVRPPVFWIVGKIPNDPLVEIQLRPRESYSDTLGFRLDRRYFENFPGYIEVECVFLTGKGPHDDEAVRLGRLDMRVAIPVP